MASEITSPPSKHLVLLYVSFSFLCILFFFTSQSVNFLVEACSKFSCPVYDSNAAPSLCSEVSRLWLLPIRTFNQCLGGMVDA